MISLGLFLTASPKLRDEVTGRRVVRAESELQEGWHDVLDKMVPDKQEQAELLVQYGKVCTVGYTAKCILRRRAAQCCSANPLQHARMQPLRARNNVQCTAAAHAHT